MVWCSYDALGDACHVRLDSATTPTDSVVGFSDRPYSLYGSYDYYAIVTNATRKLSPKCPEAVRAAIETLLASDSITITQELNLCEPLDTEYTYGKLELLQRIMNQFADTAMGCVGCVPCEIVLVHVPLAPLLTSPRNCGFVCRNYPPVRSPITTECTNLLSAPHGSLR